MPRDLLADAPEAAGPRDLLADVQPERTMIGALAEKAGALASGFNRAYLSRAGLPFNPVDAVANVLDLGRAAIGAPYIAATGKAPPDWLVPSARSDVVGSGEWLVNKARKSAIGRAALDAPNPEDQGGLIQAVGAGVGGGVGGGSSRTQEVANAALGAGSAAASKVASDLTGNDALAMTAGILPQFAVQRGGLAVKAAIRGGERGRRDMEQRVQDLKNAGIDSPTLGLASGNKLIGGVENILQSAPGAVNRMGQNRDTAISALEAQTGMAADLASTNRGALEAGRSIQRGAADFKAAFKDQQGRLYDKLGNIIGDQHPTNVDNTTTALAMLNADIPTMPALSKQFKNSRILAIEAALKSDMKGDPAGAPVTLSSILDASGKPIVLAPKGAPEPARTEIPFEAVKKTRTLVGGELADNSMMSDVPRSKWNPLYGALSEDIRGAAAQVGPQATMAFNRANDYTRAGIGRLERIAPIIDRPAPEQSFTALNSALKENVSTLQAVKKSLPQDARGDFAGTVIERLGKAKPGQQDASGTKWSPETFLTNWSNIKPQARAELLSGFPNAAQVAETIDYVAKATAMMRENSKMWANPSGTSANAAARGLLGAIGAGGAGAAVGLLSPAVPLGAAASVGGVNLLARGLTSKRVRDFAARQTNRSDLLSPENPALLQQIINIPGMRGLLSE